MFCSNCGKEIVSGIAFCPACGAKQDAGTENATQQQTTFNSEYGNSNDEWYYVKDNNRVGPCRIDSIIAEITNGGIQRNTLVWKNGMGSWMTAEQTMLNQYLQNVVPQMPDEIINNKYVWALATVPILVSWFVQAIFGIGTLTTVITIALNIAFITLDIGEIKKAGKNADNWMWLGVVLVPLYLFMRASKTDKKYAYAITWCAMFVIDLFL